MELVCQKLADGQSLSARAESRTKAPGLPEPTVPLATKKDAPQMRSAFARRQSGERWGPGVDPGPHPQDCCATSFCAGAAASGTVTGLDGRKNRNPVTTRYASQAPNSSTEGSAL